MEEKEKEKEKENKLTYAQEVIQKRIVKLSENNCNIIDYHGDYYDENYVGM